MNTSRARLSVNQHLFRPIPLLNCSSSCTSCMKHVFVVMLFLALLPRALAAARVPTSEEAPAMIDIPAGDFWMGRSDFQWLFDRNTEIERDRLDDKPAHKVYIDSFSIDKYEVTNEDYARFLKASGVKAPWYWPHGDFPEGQARFPVYNV